MDRSAWIERVIAARQRLGGRILPRGKEAMEGGCGVVGLAASVPVSGRHILRPSEQMHNRGNGKGGGIAAAGLVPEQLGVTREVLREATLYQVALLDPEARREVEEAFLKPNFEILQGGPVPTLDDPREAGLEVPPPQVWRYFLKPRPEALDRFAAEAGLEGAPYEDLRDEFVYQTSYRLNTSLYASLGEKRAFVLSHGRDLAVFKVVGYAEQAARYYRLEEMHAHIWIAHQRYPTKGRVWHPGGAHPFVGLNEALVHNGDFANYHAVAEYLAQRGIYPLFLTDTEVSVLLFDLWDRVYKYPLEVILEAMAPTGERDFAQLPPEKQALYRAVQAAHIHGSPDGPWFFILARSRPEEGWWQLLGITDTSMLRPQVFALQEGDGVRIGLIASEKQAIDAALESLAAEDPRFAPVADRYWNARGGSHTDGGAFLFTVREGEDGRRTLTCQNKFGQPVEPPAGRPYRWDRVHLAFRTNGYLARAEAVLEGIETPEQLLAALREALPTWGYEEAWALTQALEAWPLARAVEALTLLLDRPYDPGGLKRSGLRAIWQEALDRRLDRVPLLTEASGPAVRIDFARREALRPPAPGEEVLVVDASAFPPEGPACAARLVAEAAAMGWRRFWTYRWRGGRFLGSGLGPDSRGIRIDVWGSPGDYLASGLDGAQIVVHASAQDQVGQIFKAGRLVVYGDVGQTFFYGAKGGEAFVLGNAAGRPLINAVGRPRVVINGTCLDYLAESFMAGDPLKGGGFVILNGVTFDDRGRLVELPTPYPGSNLFSLASGGAIYVRDPHGRLDEDQLNGGRFAQLTDADWALIRPYLEENARLFGIPVEALLTVDGVRRAPSQVYRKVEVVPLHVLSGTGG